MIGRKNRVEYKNRSGRVVEDADVGRLIPPADEGAGALVEAPDQRLMLRPPRPADAADVWRLVEACEALDGNSPYAYLLLCSDFAETGMVVRAAAPPSESESRGAPDGMGQGEPVGEGDSGQGALVGFVLGYRPPARPQTLFVWQIAVAPECRGQGLGGRVLDRLVHRCRQTFGIEYLEATVTPSNGSSRQLFTKYARDRELQIHESLAFGASSFPAELDAPHEDEIRLRIGPLGPRPALRSA